MSVIDINWKPDTRQLRQFAWIALVAMPLVGWFWGASSNVLFGLGAAGTLLVVSGYVAPVLVRPIYLALTLITFPIGLVVGEVVMLAIYFGVFLPIGLIFKLMRRDAMQSGFDRDAKSYWQPKRQPSSADSYYRQW